MSPLIHGAVKRTNLSHTLDIDDDILRPWPLVARRRRTKNPGGDDDVAGEHRPRRGLHPDGCGGSAMRAWLPLLRKIEAYARDEGRGCVRIYRRKGWARILDGYRSKTSSSRSISKHRASSIAFKTKSPSWPSD
jgi:hypothetical protein